MNLVDANVLLYAVNEAEPRHAEARAWLDTSLSDTEAVGFAWVVLLAFVRLSTKAGLFPRPLSVDAATRIVRLWVGEGPGIVVEPTARHLDVLASLLRESGTGGNLVSDAHLAALAVEHDATIVSYDRDFQRFAGVRWSEPGLGQARRAPR